MNYQTRKRYRNEQICADPTVEPHENETALHFTAGDRRLWISSYEPTIVAGLLAHPNFQVGHLVLMRTNGQECVVGVIGKLPIGALSIGRRRISDSHELVVPSKVHPSETAVARRETVLPRAIQEEKEGQLRLNLSRKTKLRAVAKQPHRRHAKTTKSRTSSTVRSHAKRRSVQRAKRTRAR